MKKIIIPIPTYGADPTEVSIPWKILTDNNFEITFATPNGEKATVDLQMLNGERLGIWKGLLKTGNDAVSAHAKMEKSNEFCNPIKYQDIKETNFDAIFLPGGHDKRIKEYLESNILQQLIVDFFSKNKPVGAICHGVILPARSINSQTGKSVLYNYQTTSLLKSQELLAYNLTRMWLKDYYLTYPGLLVEDEVKSVLKNSKNFKQGPLPIFRDNRKHLRRGFVVKDRNYLSARWPGDAYSFSLEFVKMLKNKL